MSGLVNHQVSKWESKGSFYKGTKKDHVFNPFKDWKPLKKLHVYIIADVIVIPCIWIGICICKSSDNSNLESVEN